MKRRSFIKVIGATGCGYPALSANINALSSIRRRKIPATNEPLPVIGLGTWQTFDVGNNLDQKRTLTKVLETLFSNGGTLVDSSPMYGTSEKVVGELCRNLGKTSRLFAATKVWTTGQEAGKKQMHQSIDLLGKRPLDLIQIHNLQDWQTHLETLKIWKEEGKIRYIGITHYLDSAHREMEKIMKSYPIDFIQLNYSMASRKAEESILPLAQEKGIATLINRPYRAGALFRQVKGKTLPEWAGHIDIASWGQFFLKYLLANPAVTCVIPGTSKPHHMLDNMKAGQGRLPDEKERKKMLELIR